MGELVQSSTPAGADQQHPPAEAEAAYYQQTRELAMAA
jgi:hypothetical protein